MCGQLSPSRFPPVGCESAAADTALAQLTSRDREVLLAMSTGLSNTENADKLVVSGVTVKTDVSYVLARLDLRNRVYAVIFAYEVGLVGWQ